MKHCLLETKFKNARHRDQIRCKCDGSIRNRRKCGEHCPKFKPTFWHKIWFRMFVKKVLKQVKKGEWL